MKCGDKLEWQGVNGTCYGVVAKSENGELIILTGNGKFFPLKDVINSPSLKVIMVWFLSV